MGLTVTGIVFLCLGASCAVISTLLIYQQIGEVNRKRSEHEQIPYLFMYPGKMQKIASEYKRMYPAGKVNLWRLVFQAAAFVFIALTALFSGFLK